MIQAAADIREMVGEQVQYRELLIQMTKRDLLLRYKQTAMGFAWAVFMPLVNTLVFFVIFTKVAPIDVGMPYLLFAYSGLLIWNFTSSALRFAVTSLTSNTSLVTKVYFPREIFPFSAVLVSIVDLAVGSSILIAMMVYYQVPLSPALLALPAVVAVQVIFTAMVALLLSMGNLFYRDVKYLFDLVIVIWMFASPVLYNVPPNGVVSTAFRLNPMTPIVEAYRDVLLRGALPGSAFWMTGAASCVLFGLVWLAFHRAEFQFAESV